MSSLRENRNKARDAQNRFQKTDQGIRALKAKMKALGEPLRVRGHDLSKGEIIERLKVLSESKIFSWDSYILEVNAWMELQDEINGLILRMQSFVNENCPHEILWLSREEADEASDDEMEDASHDDASDEAAEDSEEEKFCEEVAMHEVTMLEDWVPDDSHSETSDSEGWAEFDMGTESDMEAESDKEAVSDAKVGAVSDVTDDAVSDAKVEAVSDAKVGAVSDATDDAVSDAVSNSALECARFVSPVAMSPFRIKRSAA